MVNEKNWKTLPESIHLKKYKNQNETIEYIQMNQIKVMNSGIKVN
ncbi:MAG: hypothetical protein U0O16_10675 [Holdemanella sp.]